MNVNVGLIDRSVRVAGGIALFSLVLVLDGNARWLGLVGLVPLVTGLLGWCPAYSILGISSCSAR